MCCTSKIVCQPKPSVFTNLWIRLNYPLESYSYLLFINNSDHLCVNEQHLTYLTYSAFNFGSSIAGTDLCLVSVRPGISPQTLRHLKLRPRQLGAVLKTKLSAELTGTQQTRPRFHWGRGGSTLISHHDEVMKMMKRTSVWLLQQLPGVSLISREPAHSHTLQYDPQLYVC